VDKGVSLLTYCIAIVDLFEGIGFTYYSCYCGPFGSRILAQCRCCWAPL